MFALLGFASLLVYALLFGAAGTFLGHGKFARHLLRVSGGILVVFGAGLLVERPSN